MCSSFGAAGGNPLGPDINRWFISWRIVKRKAEKAAKQVSEGNTK